MMRSFFALYRFRQTIADPIKKIGCNPLPTLFSSEPKPAFQTLFLGNLSRNQLSVVPSCFLHILSHIIHQIEKCMPLKNQPLFLSYPIKQITPKPT